MAGELWFSMGRECFRIEFYRGSGHGGQKKQKTSSACRITHLPSGSVGTAEDSRMQHVNRALAFNRVTSTKKFQVWLKLHLAVKAQGNVSIDSMLDKQLTPDKLKFEFFDPKS